ncbi:6-pyruvoyltetrahydropterin synthase [Pseudohyphozyma bogoriensis]|nr:6-pyruvoyltetrahydropterin synthase [Pseudohyphozyma bogoriensis]
MDVDRPHLNSRASDKEESSPLLFITYKARVNAVHRLWSSQLSEASNAEKYGAAMQLHGHTYSFKVTFRGPLCKKTGQVVGTDLLEDVVMLAIGEVLDRKNLDQDISWFHNRPSTLENVALFVWRNIAVIMKPHPHDVDEVKVKVDGCWRGQGPSKSQYGMASMEATYRGEMVPVSVESKFI